MNKQLIGAAGEYHAARYYRSEGYEILSANYRTRHGEIDLIVKKGEQVAFVEVKTRKVESLVTGREAVDFAKQRRIILAAQQYLQKNEIQDAPIRFDVIEVAIQDNFFTITPLLDAFTADDVL